MNNTKLMVAMATITMTAVLASAGANAQSRPLQVWQPSKSDETDPSKRVPVTPQPLSTTDAESQSTVNPPVIAAEAQTYTAAAPVPPAYNVSRNLGGFFLGVQGGKGWVYDDVDQSARMVNAGYRWQAGAVTLVGIEAAAGRLDSTTKDGGRYGALDYASIGANARFNFGRGNPVYGLVRTGYWSAEAKGSSDTVDGAYFGVGLGVDFTRNFNMSLVYTNHVYFDNYYAYDDYEISSADTLMIGAEVRF